MPDAGAGLPRVTVPVTDVPPNTVEADNVNDLNPPKLTVSTAVLVTPLKVAEIVAVSFDPTAGVVIGKVAVVDPALTETE